MWRHVLRCAVYSTVSINCDYRVLSIYEKKSVCVSVYLKEI